MKKAFLILMALVLVTVSAAACAEDAPAEHHFVTFTSDDGTVYELFVITKMNYGDDHKVTSVTGHFQRAVLDEESDCYGSEDAPGSEVTLSLAPDFRALMFETANDIENPVTVTDLYQWYVDAYCGGDEQLEGRELVFQCDLPEEEQVNGTYDFWFVTTQIEVNEQQEITYMENVFVVWA